MQNTFRLAPVEDDKHRYKRRGRVKIMFGCLKNWRRVAIRHNRCSTVFFRRSRSQPPSSSRYGREFWRQ